MRKAASILRGGYRRGFAAFKLAICLPLVVIVLVAAGQAQTQAQTQTQTLWWPQLDTYIGLTPNVQLMLLAEGAINPDAGNQQIVLGPNLDISLLPFLIPKIKTLDKTRNYYLNLRLAYRYVATVGNRSSHTHRGLIEVTPRIPLPAKFVLADRNQLVLVGAAEQVSWLYRNRLTLARSFQVHSLIFTPYIQAQVIYNSNPGSWNRYNWDTGSVVRLSAHVELDPYFRHVDTIDGTGHPLNGMGLKLELFFRNLKDR